MTQTTTNIMKSVCRKSCTNALTSCFVLIGPRARKQSTTDTGKENQNKVERIQNLMNPISLNGFLSSFLVIRFLEFIEVSLVHSKIRKLLPVSRVYHGAVIDCKVFLCFLCAVISCIFLSQVWRRVSVSSSEPINGKN